MISQSTIGFAGFLYISIYIILFELFLEDLEIFIVYIVFFSSSSRWSTNLFLWESEGSHTKKKSYSTFTPFILSWFNELNYIFNNSYIWTPIILKHSFNTSFNLLSIHLLIYSTPIIFLPNVFPTISCYVLVWHLNKWKWRQTCVLIEYIATIDV